MTEELWDGRTDIMPRPLPDEVNRELFDMSERDGATAGEGWWEKEAAGGRTPWWKVYAAVLPVNPASTASY